MDLRADNTYISFGHGHASGLQDAAVSCKPEA